MQRILLLSLVIMYFILNIYIFTQLLYGMGRSGRKIYSSIWESIRWYENLNSPFFCGQARAGMESSSLFKVILCVCFCARF